MVLNKLLNLKCITFLTRVPQYSIYYSIIRVELVDGLSYSNNIYLNIKHYYNIQTIFSFIYLLTTKRWFKQLLLLVINIRKQYSFLNIYSLNKYSKVNVWRYSLFFQYFICQHTDKKRRFGLTFKAVFNNSWIILIRKLIYDWTHFKK